jgi:hypothetical protein
MKFRLLIASLAMSLVGFTQTSPPLSNDFLNSLPTDSLDTVPKVSNWKLKAIYGLNGTQTSFVNWNAGGRNNVAALGFVTGQAYLSRGNMKWDNDISLALGGLQYIDNNLTEGDQVFQKTDDRIDIASKLGKRIKNEFFISLISTFRTQFLDGYSYPNDSIKTSAFMAPGYLSLGLGLEYKPNDNFNILFSPLAAKMTFVNSRDLANAGAFGVDMATYDTLGNIVNPGKQFRGEFGAFLKMKYNVTVAKNIDVRTKLELFSNYLNNPQNIDVNAEILWSFKVNSWFSASLQWVLVYDDDIAIRDTKGNVGPRTQFKSVLGVGISYTMKNFKEK